jgi:hypothetical protein
MSNEHDHEPTPARGLPIVVIDGRAYFADERLREYRAADNPPDRILMIDTLQIFGETSEDDEQREMP